ncbi:hypothetical protein SAMN04487906_2553 [Zhouia amylolytica]|uniref:DUF1835 domain-containing protein n=1 Tax=Zhouia amylolytica TaxID=376730 RepID=A0A1I6UL13_9FLAO|nr:DUF1835 domain-containing protein [Zhouia amylolytica]MCQ0112695.1 DUF1835 domain-containing protein [Zhouia amylolytica]SFT02088.1 hypothetical protein SAMN04487906_2553 [Zhouia amylolytica]
MSKILHITNGDSFTSYLEKLGIQGDIITWREMLCEGKTTTDVGSEHFWRNRYDYLKNTYKISKERFVEFTLKEYRRLCNQKSQREIVLWFEYDLFCQVNMIAVLSWLHKNRKGVPVSLVCSGIEDASDKLFGLSELPGNHLKKLFKERIRLTIDDIEYADYIWQLYCGDNPIQLYSAIQQNSSQLKYLTPALLTHLHRFPTVENGLNELENKTLQSARNFKIKSKEELIRHMLNDQGYYGFSDLQYKKLITNLRPLFISFHPAKLTKLGNEVVDNITNYYGSIKDENVYLGGAPKYSFLYHTETNKLLKL